MRALVLLPALGLLLAAFIPAYAQDAIELKNSDLTFVDSSGMTNIVGIVNNKGDAPLAITMGLHVSDRDGKVLTMQELPYGKVIFPGKGAPFKFRLPDGVEARGKPYVLRAEQVQASFYDTLVFNYTNMAMGDGKALIGTVRNDGPFEFHNLTVFASAHREDMADIDSVRSNVISVLRPGEVATFEATPDPAVKDQVYYYSCAGFDPNEPIPTIKTADGRFIAYELKSVAKVSSLRYENATDSIAFVIKHYNPSGGPASMKLPQLSQNQTIAILMDGSPADAGVKMDGKTISVEMFIPPGDHNVQIQGVTTVPEFPFAPLVLATVTAIAIVMARSRAAFKIS
ncbi:MAG: hypothetical protein ABI347_07840 [Nitrososphaera sp.]|jgi:hypothetical protein